MKLKKLKDLYVSGEAPLKNVPAAGNPVLNDRDAFKLKHGVYPYDGDEPPWDTEGKDGT